MRVLVLELDSGLARAIQKALEADRFVVDVSRPGNGWLELPFRRQYDVIILDLAPAELSTLNRLREKGVATPILVLDGSGLPENRLKALELGADDCLTKPFSLEELVIRVRVVLRRPQLLIHRLKVADLELDSVRRNATRGGRSIQLTPKEFAILEHLMRNAGRPVSRTVLVEHVWKKQFGGLTNIVDVYINFLRSKIDHGFDTKLIHTAYGIGYMVVEPPSEAASV